MSNVRPVQVKKWSRGNLGTLAAKQKRSLPTATLNLVKLYCLLLADLNRVWFALRVDQGCPDSQARDETSGYSSIAPSLFVSLHKSWGTIIVQNLFYMLVTCSSKWNQLASLFHLSLSFVFKINRWAINSYSGRMLELLLIRSRSALALIHVVTFLSHPRSKGEVPMLVMCFKVDRVRTGENFQSSSRNCHSTSSNETTNKIEKSTLFRFIKYLIGNFSSCSSCLTHFIAEI